MTIRAPKDFWSGVMFLAFAAVALFTARGYRFGSAGHMGPGYFPIVLGCVLAALAIVLIARSLVITGESLSDIAFGPLAIIIVGVCMFALCIERLGLIVSLIIVTATAAFASRESKPLEVAALCVALAIFSLAVFVYTLQLPIPVWPSLTG
jgi:hypothetical protein